MEAVAEVMRWTTCLAADRKQNANQEIAKTTQEHKSAQLRKERHWYARGGNNNWKRKKSGNSSSFQDIGNHDAIHWMLPNIVIVYNRYLVSQAMQSGMHGYAWRNIAVLSPILCVGMYACVHYYLQVQAIMHLYVYRCNH